MPRSAHPSAKTNPVSAGWQNRDGDRQAQPAEVGASIDHGTSNILSVRRCTWLIQSVSQSKETLCLSTLYPVLRLRHALSFLPIREQQPFLTAKQHCHLIHIGLSDNVPCENLRPQFLVLDKSRLTWRQSKQGLFGSFAFGLLEGR